jgi:hypothetical protein
MGDVGIQFLLGQISIIPTFLICVPRSILMGDVGDMMANLDLMDIKCH